VIFLSLFDIVILSISLHTGNNSLLTMFLHFSNWPIGSLSTPNDGDPNDLTKKSCLGTPLSVCLKRGCPKLPFYFGVRHTQMEVLKGDPPFLDTPKYKKSNNPLISRLKTRRPRCGYPWHRVSTNWYVPAWGTNRFPKNLVDFLLGKYQDVLRCCQKLIIKIWVGKHEMVDPI
jgi:hypothetical protein